MGLAWPVCVLQMMFSLRSAPPETTRWLEGTGAGTGFRGGWGLWQEGQLRTACASWGWGLLALKHPGTTLVSLLSCC